jgi:hypothetical protein
MAPRTAEEPQETELRHHAEKLGFLIYDRHGIEIVSVQERQDLFGVILPVNDRWILGHDVPGSQGTALWNRHHSNLVMEILPRGAASSYSTV